LLHSISFALNRDYMTNLWHERNSTMYTGNTEYMDMTMAPPTLSCNTDSYVKQDYICIARWSRKGGRTWGLEKLHNEELQDLYAHQLSSG
jgi:hypothetical protein